MGCDWLSRLAKNGQRGFFSDNGGHELITIVPTLHRQACGETEFVSMANMESAFRYRVKALEVLAPPPRSVST